MRKMDRRSARSQRQQIRRQLDRLARFDNTHSFNKLHIAVMAVLCALTVLVGAGAMVKLLSQKGPVSVRDGGKVYSITYRGSDKDRVISLARDKGMAAVGAEDIVEYDKATNTWTVRRLVDLFVEDGDETYQYTAHRGDTVAAALEANGVILKDVDQVIPSRETVIGAAIKVSIERVCRVNITADGQTVQVRLKGGTVADALKQAGVKLGDRDTCSHEPTEAVKDDMHVQISRIVNISVTADGRTRSYEVSAATVEDALEKCKISLGAEDRMNVNKQSQLWEGMRIVIQRVETKEEKDTEELDYTTKYMHTLDMAEGETKLLTAGMKGKKELTYKAVYVDGQLESRELVSEKVTAEPIKEILLRGAGLQKVLPQLEFQGGGNTSSGTGATGTAGGGTGSGEYSGPTVSVNTEAGTITDENGKQVTFTRAITGTCTAYCIPGGITSIGLEAVRGIIAVDPDIIPYGTRMYVASPDGQIVYGYGVAADTGGACMAGDIIADLCYDTLDECSIIGRRDMVLYILD